MALDPCVAAILCSLSRPVLGALNGLLAPYKAAVKLAVASVTAELLALDVLVLPVQAAETVAQGALDAARGVTHVLPLPAIEGCFDLGRLNIGIETLVAPRVNEAIAFLRKLERYLSLRDELNAIKLELDDLASFLDEITLVIESCP